MSECPKREPGLATWLINIAREATRTIAVPAKGHLDMRAQGLWLGCTIIAGSIQVNTVVEAATPCRPRRIGFKAPRRCPTCREVECACPSG